MPRVKRSIRSVKSGTKLLLVACVLSLLFGIFEVGKPLDDFLRVARNKLRAHDVSGEIVIVGIDSKSRYEAGSWPWPRHNYAEILDELGRLGAKKVFFDVGFDTKTNQKDDLSLELALESAKQPVFLQSKFTVEKSSHKKIGVFPLIKFGQHASTVSVTVWRDAFNRTWSLPYNVKIDSLVIPTMASELAGVETSDLSNFPVDYSFNPYSVPLISAVDVLKGRIQKSEIAGKDVVISLISTEIGDEAIMPGHGIIPKVYTQIIAAETLKKSKPLSIGWIPFWLFVTITTYLSGRIQKSSIWRVFYTAIFLSTLTFPVILEEQAVYVDAAPALFFLILIGAHRGWMRFKAMLYQQGAINLISGLKNFNALHDLTKDEQRVLIVAKIQNYSSIKSALPQSLERELVEEITKRLSVGANDIDLYQGDDGVFAWLRDADNANTIGDHLEATHSFFRSPLIVSGRPVHVHLTFGVDEDFERSMVNRMGGALLAAERAEKGGRRWTKADANTSRDVEWEMDLLGRLDSAISQGELWVAYQPKLDLQTKHICGAEALVRWLHPVRGELSPDQFVSLAEEQGCIGNLTSFVMSEAIEVAAKINAHGIRFEVAVNLSPRVADEVVIDDLVKTLLEKHNLDPALLTFEVTETAAMASDDKFIGLLARLRAIGANISVDDYGTGLSTLGYLKAIPATEIKIDKSFVRFIDQNQSDRVMVKSTVEMAHSLGRKVVAEGVETVEALNCLIDLGCDKAQGYFIAKPMPVRSLYRLLLVEGEKQVALSA